MTDQNAVGVGEQIITSSTDLEAALKTPLGLKLPKMMRRLAVKLTQGESPEQIATSEAMTVCTVKELLRYAASTLRCGLPSLDDITKSSKAPGRAKRPTTDKSDRGPTQFMTRTKCAECGRDLDANSERVCVGAISLLYTTRFDDYAYLDDGHVIVPSLSRHALHYCLDCIHSVCEFRVANEWFISQGEWEEFRKWKEGEAERQKIEAESKDREIADGLARGDMHAFNKEMPTTAQMTDWMGHAAPMSLLTKSIADDADGDGDTLNKADVEAAIAGDLSTGSSLKRFVAATASKIVPGGSQTIGDATQRERLLTYLNSPASRGKLRTKAREAARLWIEGLSQSQIAGKLRVDQSSVSRLINAAKKEANSLR